MGGRFSGGSPPSGGIKREAVDPRYSKAMAELTAMRARGDVDQSDFEAARDILRKRYGVAAQSPPPKPQAQPAASATSVSDVGRNKRVGVTLAILFAVFAASKACSGSDHASIEAGKCFSVWDGSSSDLVAKVKDRLRDPDSFEHVRTKSTPNANGYRTVLMEYRAKNGFGGYNTAIAVGSLNTANCTIVDSSFVAQ